MGQIVQPGNSAAALSPSRRARQVLGSRRLAEVCGRTTDAIRKWDRARSKGGTGGLIPAEFQARILRVATEEALPLTAEDLIAEPVA
jgi:hypothetical protein